MHTGPTPPLVLLQGGLRGTPRTIPVAPALPVQPWPMTREWLTRRNNDELVGLLEAILEEVAERLHVT